jgi:hypothetical protein
VGIFEAVKLTESNGLALGNHPCHLSREREREGTQKNKDSKITRCKRNKFYCSKISEKKLVTDLKKII